VKIVDSSCLLRVRTRSRLERDGSRRLRYSLDRTILHPVARAASRTCHSGNLHSRLIPWYVISTQAIKVFRSARDWSVRLWRANILRDDERLRLECERPLYATISQVEFHDK
jgi:hypothetical protein